MKRLITLVVSLVALLALTLAGALFLGIVGNSFAGEAVNLKREDQKDVPIMVYAPKGGACRGIAIISHGAGGSENGLGYLGDAMSELGYLGIVVGHPESGRRAVREHMKGLDLKGALASLITDPAAYRGRFKDIAAARQWAESKCASRSAILLGHSMGAATVMIEAGATNKVDMRGSDGFGAYIALSPQGAGLIFPENAWTSIRKPVLLLTGTEDSELGGGSWQTRTEPFNNMPAGCKWLGVIDGASHMNFAGMGSSASVEALTRRTIADFLRGVDQGDCRAAPAPAGMRIDTK